MSRTRLAPQRLPSGCTEDAGPGWSHPETVL
jgi:hypothetical protein